MDEALISFPLDKILLNQFAYFVFFFVAVFSLQSLLCGSFFFPPSFFSFLLWIPFVKPVVDCLYIAFKVVHIQQIEIQLFIQILL